MKAALHRVCSLRDVCYGAKSHFVGKARSEGGLGLGVGEGGGELWTSSYERSE